MRFRQLPKVVRLIMSLSLLQLVFSIMLAGIAYAYPGKAQELLDKRVTLRVEEMELKKVLTDLEKTTSARFIYSNQIVDAKRKISLSVSNERLSDVLERLLNPLALGYELSGTQIILVKKPVPTKEAIQTGQAINLKQPDALDLTVSGTVSDSNGEKLPGVSIVVKGSQKGTTSDRDGNYRLSVPNEDITLVFSFVGYVPQEIVVGKRTQINVSLQIDEKSLSEVVVVGFGTQKKESVTGSISSVNARDLKLPTGNMTQLLAGRLGGVIGVQRSGEPGYSSSEFWIRGFGTFSGGRYPLILIDGVERTSREQNVLDYMNPEEIESISVLKDAAATALYGVRGANGVILVTTRRGKDGPPSISARIEQGIGMPIGVPKLVNAQEYITLYNEALRNEGRPPFFSPQDSTLHVNGQNPLTHPNVDWVGELIRNQTPNQRVTLNISGGNKTVRYFVNAAYFGQSGIWRENTLERYKQNIREDKYNFRSNVDVNVTKTTLLSLILGGSVSEYNFPGAPANDVMFGLFRVPPTLFPKVFPGNRIPGTTGEQRMNPYGRLTQRGYTNQYRNSLGATLTLKQDLPFVLPGLSVKGTVSFDAFNQHYLDKRKNFYTYQIQINPTTGDTSYVETATGDDFLLFGRHFTGNRAIYMEALVNYERTFNQVHQLTGMLVYNQREFVDADANNQLGALPFRRNGLAGRVTYAYRDKYFVEGNFGYNGSENFPSGLRFGFFPSISAGWLLSEEPLLRNNVKFLDQLKLRGSYGLAGNDDIGGRRFVYIATTRYDGGWNHGDFGWRNAIKEDEPATDDVTWEIAKKLNVGFEMRLFRTRLGIQVDYFHENRTGIFIRRDLMSDIMGYNQRPFSNVGRMRNQGIDMEATYNGKVGKVDFEVKANYVRARNKVLYREEPANRPENLRETGRPSGQQFGLLWDGFFTTEDVARMGQTAEKFKADPSYAPESNDFPLHTFKATYQPGDFKYRDINGDGRVDNNDRTAIGYSFYPEYNYGLGLSLRYRGFDVSTWFQGVGNYTIIHQNEAIVPFILGGYGSATKQVMDRWHINEQGEVVEGLYPRLVVGQDANNYQPSTRWQSDLSYLRLKTAEIGYTFPNTLTKKLGLSTLRVFTNGINLLTWSKFKWWEPDIAERPFERYPVMRTINGGINLTF